MLRLIEGKISVPIFFASSSRIFASRAGGTAIAGGFDAWASFHSAAEACG